MYMPIIFEKHTSARTSPKNLKPQDAALFAHEFSKEIRETTLLTLRNVYALIDTVFSLREFRFYLSYSHLYRLPWKVLLSRCLLLFSTGKRVDKAVWITDNWSMNYFHWLTDALPRLIASEKYINGHLVLLPEVFKKYGYINDTLNLLQYKACFLDDKKMLV